jgi:Domain of unknown function (DUF4260)
MIAILTRPLLLLRIEGAVAAAVALTAYLHYGHPWWLLVLLVLAPDLAFVGYAAGPRVGAACYNAGHSYVAPLALLAAGALAPSSASVAIALIWIVHIGADRALGYGLKYPAAFKDTHLERLRQLT